MLIKTKASHKRIFLPVILAALLTLTGCSSSSSDGQHPISIEGTLISKTGSAKDKLAINQFLSEMTTKTQKLSTTFANYLKGNIAQDANHTVKFNSITAPVLILNGKSLVNDLSYTEKLSLEMPGAVATIFVRSGNDFIRIATSLKKQTGNAALAHEEIAVGSTLSHKSPAYDACLAGDTYTGTTTLFGSTYMTEYTPIKTASGNVIGIRFVGIDISSDLVLLKRKLET